MRRLFMLRHGPTHAKSMVGWSDLPADLSDRPAIARLSQFLPGEALLISSDLSRACDTADAIQAGRQRLPHDGDLREMHFGDWELRTYNEVAAEDPARARAFWENPGDLSPPNGESWNMLGRRSNQAVDRILAAHPGRDIVIVAHFGVILTQLQRGLGLSAQQVFGHKIDPLSVSEFEIGPEDWQVNRINHQP